MGRGGRWLYYDDASAAESTNLASLPIRVETLVNLSANMMFLVITLVITCRILYFLQSSGMQHGVKPNRCL